MRFLRFVFVGFVFALLMIATVKTTAYADVTWTETQPAGAQDLDWYTTSMSDNGQKIIAGVYGGRIYISSNGGATWSETRPAGNQNISWVTSAMSSDGQTIVVGVEGGRLYRSIDGGSNWSEIQPAGDQDEYWHALSISPDGTKMIAGVGANLLSVIPGRLYVSTDSGDTWTETQPAGDVDKVWYTASISSDGQTLLAAAGEGGRVYLSTNGGTTWSETRPEGDTDDFWYTSDMSANGQILAIATDGDRGVYVSTDQGANWTLANLGFGNFRGLSMSYDGSKMLVGIILNKLYLSTDTGSTWNITGPSGSYWWTAEGMSGDGKKMIAGVFTGRLYIGSNPLPTPTPGTTGNSSNSSSSSNSPSTPTCSTTPNGTPNLFQIDTTKNSATLYFSPVGNAQNYLISYGFDSNANQFNVFTNQGSSTGVLSYTIGSLPSNSTVNFKVYAQNNCGQGSWSNTMLAKTSGANFYKNLGAQVLTFIPHQTTALKVSAKPNSVSSVVQVQKNPTKQSVKTSPKPIKNSSVKKSCFLFVCL